jgi:hypothetical protein
MLVARPYPARTARNLLMTKTIRTLLLLKRTNFQGCQEQALVAVLSPGLWRTRKLEIHVDVYGVYQDLT